MKNDSIKQNSEDLKIIKDKTINFMTAPGHGIGIISGSKGSGQTLSTVYIIEEFFFLAGLIKKRRNQ